MRKFILSLLTFSVLCLNANAVTVVDSITGTIDLRPSWTTKGGTLGTEDLLAAGYKITPDTSVSYFQALTTNLLSREASSSGVNAQLDVGYLKTKVNNLWVSDSKDLSLSYENRTYLPVNQAAQDSKMITTIRNYLKLRKKISESVSVSAFEIPIVHLHEQAGVTLDGTSSANAAFSNRVYLIADITLSAKLSLSVPILFHQTKHRDFASSATNNDSWRFLLWINPELTYSITDNYSVGLGYYSDNLVLSDLSQFDIGNGLEKGIVQLAFTASL